jgi:hypothetical protein
VFAQDRVILFESTRGSILNLLPGEIRELEITQGGRAWSVKRTVPLPGHLAHSPVALADGSRIAWLAISGNSTLLVQYDATTARASIVDIGVFAREAFLVSDPLTPRLYIIEPPRRVTFVDYRLQQTTIELAGTKAIVFGQSNGSHLVLLRRDSTDDEVVVIDLQTGTTANVIPLGEQSQVRVSRNGRLYRQYRTLTTPSEERVDVLSLPTGMLIARSSSFGGITGLFEIDDTRGVVVHNYGVSNPTLRAAIIVRDAVSLAVIGEFAPRMFSSKAELSLSQTASRTIFMFSLERVPSYLSRCADGEPRIDVFDGTTFALVNRIDLQRRCPSVVPLPSR